jgi:acetylornithine/N-succinyldiaminopimelate aminotransferase
MAMAVGNAVFDVMSKPGFMEHISAMGTQLKTGLEKLVAEFPVLFKDVRGRGLILGVELKVPAMEMVEKLRARHLLITAAEGNVLRIVPPLIIDSNHIDEALAIMHSVAREWP